nr:Cas8a1 family CRISPR/Cas system-associated protein [Pectinatus sottacetonis]
MYSRINSIWSGKSFLNTKNAKKDIKKIYYSDFIEPVIKYLQKPPKERKSSRYCIVCDAVMSKPIDISFLNDSADDMSRKKSAFWNCKPDAQLCPLCAFIYSMAPLGFVPMQRDMLFVNDNVNIRKMQKINNGIKAENEIPEDENDRNLWYQIWNKIIQNIIKNKLKALRNIQVVVRKKDTGKYNFNIIAKDILDLLERSFKYIGYIGNKFIKTPSGINVNIQEEVLKNIFRRTDLYAMMNKILNYSMKENIQVNFLDNVLQIQQMIVGGKKMEQDCVTQDDIVNIKAAGKQLRSFAIVDKNGMNADEDGKLRGYAYKLLGALRVNDQAKFWQILTRMYLGYSKAIPETNVFLKAFKNEDNFKQLGYAYILGLKDNHKVEKNIKQKTSVE